MGRPRAVDRITPTYEAGFALGRALVARSLLAYFGVVLDVDDTCPHDRRDTLSTVWDLARADGIDPERIPKPVLAAECPRGHAFTEANTWFDTAGSRRCRQCHRDRNRAAAGKR